MMQGATINESDIQNFGHYFRVIGNITGEIIPIGTTEPVYIPHVALTQEYEIANALFYMCRSVKNTENKKHFIKIYCL